MKFMVTYAVHQGKMHDAFKTFGQMTDADDEADRGGVQLIGRWHDVGGGNGVAICESADLAAVSLWALNWNNDLEIGITPVLDDDEAKGVAKKKFGF